MSQEPEIPTGTDPAPVIAPAVGSEPTSAAGEVSVKGPRGKVDAQAPARPKSARAAKSAKPAGRTATAKAPTAPKGQVDASLAPPPVATQAAPSPTSSPASASAPAARTASGRKGKNAGSAPPPAHAAPAAVAPAVAEAGLAEAPADGAPAAMTGGATAPTPVFAPTSTITPGVTPELAGRKEPRDRKPTASATLEPIAGPTGDRKFRLQITHLSPWSVMKLSFLLSLAIGIGIVVMFYVFWVALDKAQVFSTINDLIVEVAGPNFFKLMDYVGFQNAMSAAVLIAVADIVILTLLSTLMAVLYNLVANLVGGLHITLGEDV